MEGELLEINHSIKIMIKKDNISNVKPKYILEILEKEYKHKINQNFLILEIFNPSFLDNVIHDINREDFLTVFVSCKLIGLKISKGSELRIKDLNDIKKKC